MRTLPSLSLLVVLLASLAFAASGCDNVESGAGAAPTPGADDDDDDGAVGDDDDDDDGGGGSGTPIPGSTPPPVPDMIGGQISLGFTRSYDNDPPAGLGGSAMFLTNAYPVFLKEPYEALYGHYPDMAMDTCGWGWGASVAIGGSGQLSASAGTVTLSTASGGGDFFFLPLGGLQLYLMQSQTGVYLADGGTYTLSATGDQVGAFTTEFLGPADVSVSEPADLTSAGPITIDRSQDMPLEWTSHDDGLPVFVFILRHEQQDQAPQVVVCKFEDDGSAVIPASAFGMVDATEFGVKDRLQIAKYRVATFQPPGVSAPLQVLFFAGYDIETIYE